MRPPRLEATDSSVRDFTTRVFVKDGSARVTIKLGNKYLVHTFTFPLREYPGGAYDRQQFLRRLAGGPLDTCTGERLLDSVRSALTKVAAKMAAAGLAVPPAPAPCSLPYLVPRPSPVATEPHG